MATGDAWLGPTAAAASLKRLSAAQQAQFTAQGYLAPLDALPPEQAADCARRLTALLAPLGGRPDAALRNNPHLLLRWMADLVYDRGVLDAVEDLLGPNLLALRSALFVKAPHDAGRVEWHQDLAYWDLRDARVVTAWIALTDSRAANGGVRVVPGSHRGPLRDHTLAHDRQGRFLRGQLQLDVPPQQIAHLELRAGQMSLHHGRLLHSSPGNPTDRLRAGLAIRYIPPDVRPAGPRLAALLVRGVDAHGYYDRDVAPRFDRDPGARACHARALRRYALHSALQTLRRPSLAHLGVALRMAARADLLRAMLPRGWTA